MKQNHSIPFQIGGPLRSDDVNEANGDNGVDSCQWLGTSCRVRLYGSNGVVCRLAAAIDVGDTETELLILFHHTGVQLLRRPSVLDEEVSGVDDPP